MAKSVLDPTILTVGIVGLGAYLLWGLKKNVSQIGDDITGITSPLSDVVGNTLGFVDKQIGFLNRNVGLQQTAEWIGTAQGNLNRALFSNTGKQPSVITINGSPALYNPNATFSTSSQIRSGTVKGMDIFTNPFGLTAAQQSQVKPQNTVEISATGQSAKNIRNNMVSYVDLSTGAPKPKPTNPSVVIGKTLNLSNSSLLSITSKNKLKK